MVRFLIILLVLATASGCSVRRFAVDRVGDALAGSGGTFAADEDPELVKAAVPFGLKLQESLLAESPRHRELLLGLASGFTQYAYAFVQLEADEVETRDVAAAKAMRLRAKKLYLRARGYGLRGLEVGHAGFEKQLHANPKQAVVKAGKSDVPLLYWTAAAWGAAIAVSKDPELIADQLTVEALMDRALALDEGYANGAIHTFLISYEMARQGGKGEAAERAGRHFLRARELSGPHVAGPLVAYAEAVCVAKQDRKEFERLLREALAIDVNARPASRLENIMLQRRAAWLIGRADELFVE
jgi:predicted anti-sigma-YlaC factor YlaD